MRSWVFFCIFYAFPNACLSIYQHFPSPSHLTHFQTCILNKQGPQSWYSRWCLISNFHRLKNLAGWESSQLGVLLSSASRNHFPKLKQWTVPLKSFWNNLDKNMKTDNLEAIKGFLREELSSMSFILMQQHRREHFQIISSVSWLSGADSCLWFVFFYVMFFYVMLLSVCALPREDLMSPMFVFVLVMCMNI